MKKILLSLSLVTVALTSNAQTACSELFISEYAEGKANNKAMEFYNPTANQINLSNYRLVRYSNGSATGADSTDLVGTINAGATFVIANGTGVTSGTTSTSPACSPTLQAKAQQLDHPYPNPTAMNGDDAMVLVKISPYKIIDIFGKIGEQPATAWSDVAPYNGTAGKWWTKDHSMQRKASVQMGVTANPVAFNPKAEYDSLSVDNWTNIGMHTCSCPPVGIKEYAQHIYLKVFPNPSNGSEIAFVSDKNILSVVIVNAIGQVIVSHNALNTEKTVILKNTTLVNGLYYATVKTEAGTKTEKLIIQ